jgi:Ca2+/Na+ antiporter
MINYTTTYILLFYLYILWSIKYKNMTEILQSNFKENFKTLEASLENAIFVAIDAEFSGIRNSGENPRCVISV